MTGFRGNLGLGVMAVGHFHLGGAPILLVLIVVAALIFAFTRRSGRRRTPDEHGSQRTQLEGREPSPEGEATEVKEQQSTTVPVSHPSATTDATMSLPGASVASLLPQDGSEDATLDGESRRRRASVTTLGDNGTWAVETHGLTKKFGDTIAVDEVELLVPRGSAFGYLGPNGAGKTTLIRTLLGLTRADVGTMSLLGYPVPRERREALARVGAIVDSPGFHAHLTGKENLAELAAARGNGAEKRIGPALARVGLSDRADQEVGSYSMGMRQRLGVAGCLLGDPQLLILDEPMNGLDPAGMQEMRSMIRGLVDEGRTVMLSSHLLDEVERTCDAVAIVDRGRVIRQGPIDSLIRGAGTTEVRIDASNPHGAVQVIGRSTLAARTALDGSQVVVTLPNGASKESVAELNRLLVQAGISVYGLREVRASLEDWFLSVTSRLGGSE
ncbi:MAG: ABC transporter ATP-binding protein [Acidimicrobiales bacterium]